MPKDWAENRGYDLVAVPILPFLIATSGLLTHAWTERLGTYRLEKWVNVESEIEELRLKDRKGRVVTTVRDFRAGLLGIYPPFRPERICDLTGDGIPEVVMETWTGGAHGSQHYYIWSLGKRPRCLLAYDKNNVWGDDKLDFKFDKGQIRTWYDGFAYSVAGAYTAMLPVVLRHENGRFVDRTSAAPNITETAMRESWQRLKKRSWWKSEVIRLYALGLILGKERSVDRRLHHELTSDEYKWIRVRRKWVAQVVKNRYVRYQYPRAYDPKPVRFPILSNEFEEN